MTVADIARKEWALILLIYTILLTASAVVLAFTSGYLTAYCVYKLEQLIQLCYCRTLRRLNFYHHNF